MKSFLAIHGDAQNAAFFTRLQEECVAQGFRYAEKLSLGEVTEEELMAAGVILIEINALQDLDFIRHLHRPYGLVFQFNHWPSAEQKQLLSWAKANTNVHSLVDINHGVDFYWPFWHSWWTQQEKAQQEQDALSDLHDKVQHLVAQGQGMTEDIRQLHHRLLRGRQQKLKNMTVWSKFAAGEGAGGDYFDFQTAGQDFYIFMAHTNSYLLASTVLATFDQWRQDPHLQFEKLINLLAREAQGHAPQGELQAWMAKIDLRHLRGQGFCFGPWVMISSGEILRLGNSYPCDKAFAEAASFDFKLGRQEVFGIFSPGVTQNLQKAAAKKELIDFFRPGLNKKPRDVMEEIFFQMQRAAPNSFLTFDASAVLLEVDANALWEVG
ncbi:MAG: hypothetical protein J6Y94_00435 [Bacteriovoracaceae bacterium]|nr:hypothetical protein [Bacteriovoracaceae bacterium]